MNGARTRGGSVMAALVAIAGCGSILAPQPDLSRFFVLTPTGRDMPAARGTGELSIGLGPVRFPQYLDREEVATRVASNQVEYSPNDRWAEPLESNFRRVLEADLATALGNAHIVRFPWYGSAAFDYRIEVEVERFERGQHGDTHLAARWTIRKGTDGKPLLTRESVIEHAAESTAAAASVAALSLDIEDLSDQIATAVTTLGHEGRRASES